MSSFVGSLSCKSSREIGSFYDDHEESVEKKPGLWNGRVVTELNDVVRECGNFIRRGEGALTVSSEYCWSEVINCAGSVAIAGGCCCLLIANATMIATFQRRPISFIDFLFPNIFWGSCVFLGSVGLGAVWYKGRCIKQRIEIRNKTVERCIERIQEIIHFFEGLSPDEPVDTEALINLLDVFKELKTLPDNWQSITEEDISSDNILRDLVISRKSLYSCLSCKQLCNLLREPDVDEDTREWLEKLHDEKKTIVQALCRSSPMDISSTRAANFIRYYAKDVFVSEPEVFCEYIEQLPKEVVASPEIKAAITFIENKIGNTIEMSSTIGKEEAVLSHNDDVTITIAGESLRISMEKALLCETFKARIQTEESPLRWSDSAEAEEGTLELVVELPEEFELDTFKQMLQSLYTRQIPEDMQSAGTLLGCADFFGAIPVIELCQLAFLRVLGENSRNVLLQDLMEKFQNILSKTRTSHQVHVEANRVLKKVVLEVAEVEDWESVKNLLQFAQSATAFEPFFEWVEFDLSRTGLLPVHVELAFDFNLVAFQGKVKEILISKIISGTTIRSVLEQYQVSFHVKPVLREIVKDYLRQDLFKDVWEYAENMKDVDLKKICLVYAKAHPREVLNLWSAFEIPEPIAAHLIS